MGLAYDAEADTGGPYLSHIVFDPIFTPAECEAIRLAGDACQAESARLEGIEDEGDPGLRRNLVAWLDDTEEFHWVFERLAEVAEEANRQYRFELRGFTEELQYTVYDDPGSFYTWHQDGLDGQVAGRKLSVVIQLSPPEDYEGAELHFLEVVMDYDADEQREWLARSRAQGAAVVFPAFEYHEVSPLVSGRRTSLVAWIGGPPFR